MRGFRSLLAAFSPTHNDSTKLNNLPTTLSLSSSYLWYVLLVNKKSTRGCICSQWHRSSPPIKGAPALLGGGRMGFTRKIKYEFTRLLTRRGAGWSLGVFYSRPYHLLPLPFHFLSHNFKPFDGGGDVPLYLHRCMFIMFIIKYLVSTSTFIPARYKSLGWASFSRTAASLAHDVLFEDVSYHVTHNFLPRKWMPLGVIARKSL